MPVVVIRQVEGKTIEQKRAVVKEITESIAKNYQVKPEVVTVFIQEMPRQHISVGGTLAIDR